MYHVQFLNLVSHRRYRYCTVEQHYYGVGWTQDELISNRAYLVLLLDEHYLDEPEEYPQSAHSTEGISRATNSPDCTFRHDGAPVSSELLSPRRCRETPKYRHSASSEGSRITWLERQAKAWNGSSRDFLSWTGQNQYLIHIIALSVYLTRCNMQQTTYICRFAHICIWQPQQHIILGFNVELYAPVVCCPFTASYSCCRFTTGGVKEGLRALHNNHDGLHKALYNDPTLNTHWLST